MGFSTILFTEKGRALQSKVLAGAVLNFTRIGMGSGSLGGQSQVTLNALIEPKVSLTISQVKKAGNYATVEGNFTNADVNTGFYWREIGIFAQDPDLGEILYCYGNAGTLAEYIPPQSSEVVEKVVNVSVIVGDTANVTIQTNPAAFATKAEVAAVSEKADQAFQSASNGKTAIKTAITGIDPSVTIPTDATFTQLATAIGQIKTGVDTGDATATAEQILAGLTAYVKGTKVTGAMPRRNSDGNGYTNMNSKKSNTFPNGTGRLHFPILPGAYLDNATSSNPANNKDTPMGYIDDTNFISANILSGKSIFGLQGKSTVVDTEDAVLDPAYLLTGYSGYDDGVKKNGTMPNRDRTWSAPVMAVPQQGVLYVVPPDGWYAGSTDWSNRGGVKLDDSNFVPSNILNTASIFGLQGAAIAGKRWASGTLTTSQVWSSGSITVPDVTGESRTVPVIQVSGLSFTPSLIYVYTHSSTDPGGSTYNARECSIYLAGDLFNGYRNVKIFQAYGGINLNTNVVQIRVDGAIYVNSSGFKIPMHFSTPARDDVVAQWIAFE